MGIVLACESVSVLSVPVALTFEYYKETFLYNVFRVMRHSDWDVIAVHPFLIHVHPPYEYIRVLYPGSRSERSLRVL